MADIVAIVKGNNLCGRGFDPPSEQMAARTCKSSIDRCDRKFPDKKTMSKKCKSRTSYVYAGLQVFKNKDCASCSYVNGSYLSCEDTRTPRVVHGEAPLISTPYTVLLDFNSGTGSVERHHIDDEGQKQVAELYSDTQACPANHIFDHFRGHCRMLICDDTQKVNGDCDAIDNVVTSASPPDPTTDWSSPVLPDMSLEPRFEWVDVTESIVDDSPDNKEKNGVETTKGNTHFPEENLFPYDPRLTGIDPNQRNVSSDDGPLLGSLVCPLIELRDTEYIYFNKNHSIYVYKWNRVYSTGQFEYHGPLLYVCDSEETTESNNIDFELNRSGFNATLAMFQFNYLQSFLSFTGLLLSMMALFVMLTLFLFLPPLHTVSGMSAMSLALTVLIAQALFLFGMPRPGSIDDNICLVLGASLHYFLLASFFWLNVLSFDIYSIFSRSYEAPSGGSWRRFVVYSLYGWLGPACIVSAALSLDFLKFADDIFQPHYAEHICWIVRRYALLCWFAVPVAVLLAMNILLYIATLFHSMHSNKEKCRAKLLVYTQLSFIMGLAWIFAFIATLTDMWYCWYLFIGFNSLQGIFICFAFVCNRKVFGIIRGKETTHAQKDDVRFSNGHHRTFSSARHTFFMDGEAQIIAQETSI